MNNKLWEKSYPKQLKNYQLNESLLSGSVSEFCLYAAQHYQDQPAFSVVLPNGFSQSLSFKEIHYYSDHFANYLKHVLKLNTGDVVAIQMPNSLHYPIAVFGIWKAGLILTNINPLYTATELKHKLQDSGAKLLIACDLFLKTAQPVLNTLKIDLVVASLSDFFNFPIGLMIKMKISRDITTPDIPYQSFKQALKLGEKTVDPLIYQDHPIALYQYTGGTTGRSKGAVISHRNLLVVMKMAEDFIQAFSSKMEIQQGDNILTALPMYHIFAFNFNFLLMFHKGGHNILIPNPRPLDNLKKAFQQFRISWLTGVDTLYAGLLQQTWFRNNPPPLKVAISGGTSLRPSTAIEWEKVVSPIVEGYGMTESCCMVSINPPSINKKLGSIGLPLPSLELKIVNDQGQAIDIGQAGELWVKGANMIEHYLNNPIETANSIENGWFKTGDIATMDEDGFLKIVDRKKDLIIVSGFNVYPNEIEDVLTQHPEIIEAAVIGIADETTGEAVKAFIVVNNHDISTAEIIGFCKQSLTNYKIPKHIEFRTELPKSPIGKILRAQLRS